MSIRKSFVFTLMAGFVALLSAVSQPVLAASGTCSSAPCTTPDVDLNFQVIIPNLVRLRIGSVGSVDTLLFDMSGAPGAVGDGNPVTGSGGDAGGSSVNVAVIANGGITTSVQVDTSVTGGGSGIDCTGGGSCIPTVHFIPWDQITVTGSGCSVTPPILDNNGFGFATYLPGADGTINEVGCVWQYEYANGVGQVPVDGTYFGTVHYTATVTP